MLEFELNGYISAQNDGFKHAHKTDESEKDTESRCSIKNGLHYNYINKSNEIKKKFK